MQDVDRELARKWDQRHATALDSGSVAALLVENNHLLSRNGEALDLACGRGASALYLARRGMRVTAWDLSAVAIDRLQQSAREQGMTIACAVRDVIAFPPWPGSFDLILVSYFLERSLAPAIIQALRPGGLLFFETFCVDAVSESGPSNPAFRLGRNELLVLFRPLEVVFYREEGRIGETRLGVRDIAQLVARKPAE
ncbi:MAG: methyltransferase domain-containing protein [Gammaproteobacteria bacterium]|nr:methyltransferase domain-containing protein [Gammaproteobacteria bacterium]